MSILVVCPRCRTSLNLPDSTAGKQVRCLTGGCGMLIRVPGLVDAVPVDDNDEDERPRGKRRNDNDDDYDRPRRKCQRYEDDYDDYEPVRRRRGKSRTNIVPILLLVLGIAVIAGLLGWGVYALVTKGKKSGSSTPPSGWKEFIYKDNGFKAYFPKEPTFRTGSNSPIPLSDVDTATIYGIDGWGTGDRKLIMVAVLRFRNGNAPPDLDKAINELKDRSGKADTRVSGPRTLTWAGQKAREITMEPIDNQVGGKQGRIVVRYTVVNSRGYLAMIGGENADALRDEESGFFNNFEFLK
jgi:hypothetical protein